MLVVLLSALKGYCNILFSLPDAIEETPMLHAPDSKVLMSSDCVAVYTCVHNHTCHAVLLGQCGIQCRRLVLGPCEGRLGLLSVYYFICLN